jgi:hypothetical protein
MKATTRAALRAFRVKATLGGLAFAPVLRLSRPGDKYLAGSLEAVAGFDKLGSVSS